MKGEICSVIYAAVFVPAMILAWLRARDAWRRHRAFRAYRNLTAETRDHILNRIDVAGRANRSCTVLVATDILDAQETVIAKPGHNPLARDSDDGMINSRFGGVPYAEAGDVWPVETAADKTEPPHFLIQVRLDDSFPPPWPGRLVVVFQMFQPTARCYAMPAAGRAFTLTGGPGPAQEWKLRPVCIPRPPIDGTDNDPATTERNGLLDYDPTVLLSSIPGLEVDLVPHTQRPRELLALLLTPTQFRDYGFELSDIVQLGGKPVWLNEELQRLNCNQCGQAMRFLFQFGDLSGGDVLGDSGVCYVFGCDEHPDRPQATVQKC